MKRPLISQQLICNEREEKFWKKLKVQIFLQKKHKKEGEICVLLPSLKAEHILTIHALPFLASTSLCLTNTLCPTCVPLKYLVSEVAALSSDFLMSLCFAALSPPLSSPSHCPDNGSSGDCTGVTIPYYTLLEIALVLPYHTIICWRLHWCYHTIPYSTGDCTGVKLSDS